MKFYNMGDRPLEYPVRCGSKIVIPAGAKHVKIAFGASPFTYIHPATSKVTHLNVYIWKNRMYHA